MSCFIMGEKPVAALADYIAYILNAGDAPPALFKALNDCVVNGRYDEAKIYDALYALNIAAYRERYLDRHPEIEAEIKAIPAYAPNIQHATRRRPAPDGWKERMLKRIDCFLYQCSIHPVYELPLNYALAQLGVELAGDIARSQPEYEKAIWGE